MGHIMGTFPFRISTFTFARCLHGVFDAIDRWREARDPQEDEQLHGEGGCDERECSGCVGSERRPDASEADDEHLLDATCPLNEWDGCYRH